MTPGLVEKLTSLDLPTLGSRIKAARLAAGLTQVALGADDASIAYISRIESGARRPGPALVEALCARLGVTPEEIVLGYATGEDPRRHELALDYAELQLVGGDAEQALRGADDVLAAAPTGARLLERARFLQASALDALGDPRAVGGYRSLLSPSGPGQPALLDVTLRLRAATSLSRILRERGELTDAISVAATALDTLGPDRLEGAEEAVRLTVTLAAAVYEAGDVERATELCRSAICEADRLKSPAARGAAYWNASIIEAEAGRIDRALDLARRALDLFEGGDDVRHLGNLRIQFSTLLLQESPPRVEEALSQLDHAEKELAWSGATVAQSVRRELVAARAWFLAGDGARARTRAELAVSGAGEHPLIAVSALTLLGQMEWADDDLVGAETYYRRAIALLTGIGSDREAGQLWFDLGALLDDAGLTAEARDAYKRAAACLGLAQRPMIARPRVLRS